MEKHGFISVVAILLFVPVVCSARTIRVPADFSSIQAAIDDANDYDEIEVAPGTYNEAINFNSKAIRLYSSGGRDVTTIDATGLNSSVVTCSSGEDANTILEGFTITGGMGTTVSGYKYGGGMYNLNSSPTVTDCNFTTNSVTGDGGGMYNRNSSPTVTNCIFVGNSASYAGGGIDNRSGSSPTVTGCTFSQNTASTNGGGMENWNGSSPTVTDCNFSGNNAVNGGGGMYNSDGSDPNVTNCTFSGNTATNSGGGMWNNNNSNPMVTYCNFSGNSASNYYGGGMYNIGSSPKVINCTFTGNTTLSATYGDGAGMSNRDGSSPTVTDCNFIVNQAIRDGGGMHNYQSNSILTNCTFKNNTANWAGGMYNYQSSPTVTDCTFSGNEANNAGGGMINNSSSSPTVTNCTFTGNTVLLATYGYGGGMQNVGGSNPNVTNCTFTGGNARNGGGMYCESSSPTVTNCTFGNNSAMYGGGMFCDQSQATVTNCLFLLNSSSDDAGAVISANNGSLQLVNCTFRDNTAVDKAGAVYCLGSDTSTIVNCAFIGNSSSLGGGLFTYNGATPRLINCTFSGNSAPDGGAIFNFYNCHAVAENCIFWGDTPNEIINIDNSSATVTYSNVQGGYTGTGNIDQDPCFVDPDANDFRLLPDSPCVDAGDTGAVPADTADLDEDGDTTEPIPFDLIGNPRIWNVIVDMGAIEYGELRVHNVTQNASYIGIQRAINDANNGDQIEVDPGTYKEETIDFKGKAIRLYSTAGPNDTIIDGTGNYHVFQCISGEGPDTILEGFTITGGNANGSGSDGYGGGMHCENGSPTLANCNFSNNSATVNGGGMHSYLNSSPTLTNCTFSGNSAYYGGGMYNYQGSPTMTGCTFFDNKSYNHGGGMYNYQCSPTVTGCTFFDNESDNQGGGMYNKSSSPTVTNCTFSGNSANSFGGGMCNYYSSPTVTNCEFSQNLTYLNGGGIWSGHGSLTIVNCTISGNTAASNGGGMFNDHGPITVTNCTFSGNTAGGVGGAMRNWSSSPTVTNCTFSENTAVDNGGGMYNANSSKPIVTNCILWGDSPDEIDNDNSTSIPTVTYCDIQGGYFGTGNIDVNPRFVDLWHGDFRPRAPECVDAGNNAKVPPGITMDIRGKPRFIDDPNIPNTGSGTPPIVDMGAYERQPEDIFKTITVDDDGPADFDTIQAAIDDASHGDEIEVAPGIYYEAINPKGKAVWLYSIGGPAVTTINGRGAHHVVQCINDEGPYTILDGFTITGGNARGIEPNDLGGSGMYNYEASPTVVNCIFTDNTTDANGVGGGMCNYSNSSPFVTNCAFMVNEASRGGGMANYGASNPMVTNCTFNNNSARAVGGGMYSDSSSPTITNCIFWGNTAGFSWENQIYPIGAGTVVTYSNVQGGYGGTGNINADPLFALSAGEPHLGFGSPCIDTGTNMPVGGLLPADPDSNPRKLDGDGDGTATVDMGAFEFNPDPQLPCMVVWPPVFEFIAHGGQAPPPGMLEILNIGSGILNWIIEADCSWLELNRTGGQSSGEIDNVILDPNISDLPPGKYHCTLTITDPNAVNSPLVIEVALSVGCVRQVPTTKYPTIRSAIEDSNDGDIILVADGTYYEYDLDFGGKAILVESENGPENCIIDCNGLGRGFYFGSGETQDSILDGFNIRNGNAIDGGGICIREASPTIRNCDVNSCEASSSGGAIWTLYSNATLSNCTFRDNTADLGGGMYSYFPGMTVTNCTFEGNFAYGVTIWSCGWQDVGAGGICNDGGYITITNCTFSDNHTPSQGGGMYNSWCSPRVRDCTFTGNTASYGGGMVTGCVSSAQVTNCTFSDNEATYEGGGVYVWGGNPRLTNCIFRGNSAELGGGIYQLNAAFITNCAFHGNTATNNGGGMYSLGTYGSLTNCTFTGNNGGGIWNNGSSLTVTNCILWGNTGGQISGTAATVTYSCVENGTVDTTNIASNPDFVNAGAGDLRLQVMSPCIDTGRSIAGIHCDVRGSVRPIDISADGDNLVNNNFDMGAYEYSRYYSGTEDGNVPAFRDVEIPSYCLVEEPVEIKWKNHPGFPDDDIRITDPKAYQVNLVLVSEDRTREITLNDEPITVPSTTMAPDMPYNQEYTFKAIHAGRWYLRIELSEDGNQYVESTRTFLIGLREPKLFEIGRQITPPKDADLTIDPTIEEGREDYFFWSDYARKLYAVGPIAAVVEWTDTRGDPLPVLVGNVWPYEMQTHVADSPAVELLPEASQFSFVEVRYADNDAVVNGSQFSATSEGRCVLMYGDNANYDFVPQFEVVRTVLWNNPEYLQEAEWPIGTEVTDPNHNDDCGSGHIYREISPYDADIYDRDTRSGQIFAVNLDDPGSEADDLIIFWYDKGIYGADWPYLPMRYDPKWPSTHQEGLEKIVIASCLGSEVYDQDPLEGTHKNMLIYNQPDPALPGCNPNEEHAAFFPSNQISLYQAVYALRNDLNRMNWNDPNYNYTSEPYVLLKYQDIYDIWHYRVFEVLVEDPNYVLRYATEAGWLMQPPYPLYKLLPGCDGFSYADMPGPWWTDYNSKIWARHAGPSEVETATGTIRWFYPLLEGFYYDFDQDGMQDEPVGTCVPWLDLYDSNSMPGVPIAVTYDVHWPSLVPELQVGETLMKPKRGLPDITNQCSVEIIYDEPNDVYGIAGAVKLIEPLSEHRVDLLSLPSQIKVSNKGGIKVFDDLPFHLRARFYYDPLNHELVFRGYFDDTVVGEPILLLNVISDREKAELRSLPGADSTFQAKVDELYILTQEALEQNQTKLIGGSKALSAGTASAEGFVTLVFADDKDCSPLPVSVEVIKVVCGPYRGELKVIESDNVFDERITFRHSGDFGGRPEGRLFEWMYSLSQDKPNDPNLELLQDNWQTYVDPCEGNAVLDITVGGPGLIAVQDRWFSCRYYDETCGQWSLWTEPQLHESWIKRVNRQVNLFDQRFKDFHESQINTLVSMIGQIGQRYEGNVALTTDPANINSIGMLELYETLFRRAAEFSIDQGINDPLANSTLLFASSRIAALYTLLGNEAYADALDPTIGFTTEGVDYGVMAPVIHCFQNQTDSLLSEELSLLRGLESDPYPQPLYNRLVWNFTSGDGEFAYASNYVITDMDDDGDIDEYDARIMYPQGHGDAWGHYLMALKTYYRLLVHPDYTWVPQPEYVLVAGTPVEVDYFDERQFAKIAAAKAKAGAEIVDLTYRQKFDEDPENQWQGYKDTDSSRAWGVDGWASRAGQGAYFDWVVANSLLPDVDTDANHTGLQKVDRATVLEIRDIASSFNEVQAKLDMADLGLNPLGIAKDAIPFDINPFELVDALGQPSGRTHFEQIYERALTALNNTLTAFNFANQSTQLLRRQQDSLENFTYNVEQRELDFRNRLIEIFGYPYDDDIGPTGTYPEGYDGPDLYHYMYVDPSELMSSSSPEPIEFTVTFKEPQVSPQGALSYESRDVVFHLSPDGLGLIKPASWTGSRRAPGELQMARSDLLQAKANFDRALLDYGNLLEQIEDQADILQAQYNLDTTELYILNKTHNKQESLNIAILAARGLELMFRGLGRRAVIIADAMAEFIPTNVEVTGGDVGAPGRGAIKFLGASINEMFTTFADVASMGELAAQQAKERAQSLSNIEITAAHHEFAELQQLKQLEQLVRTEASQRLGLFTLAETMQQVSGRYLAALARGIRIYEELTRFRKQTAADIQHYRYKDMTFRVFRHDALQKYRAQFDLAAMYAYLAAKAYDYETALLDEYTEAGQHFLNRIVRQRTIGQISQNVPIPGEGLGGVLAELNQNFDVFKTMMGFNNPQIETTWFSLRKEHFRIAQYAASNSDWQKELDKYYVDDLWDLPEFRRYCRPFDTEDVALPAIVIPFQTNITNGLNFFGWPGGADPFYAPENFVTKIRSVGIWFSNYDTSIMSPTPRVYLIPIGEDVVRADIGEIRSWQVVEQSIPLPFTIGEYELANNFDWIPMNDSVPSPLAEIRRYTRFRAYPDGGFNPTEMTYDSRLIGRSVWNTRWLLIIPGHSLYLSDPWEGMERFLFGAPIPGGDGERTGNGATDIKLFFKTYAYPGY